MQSIERGHKASKQYLIENCFAWCLEYHAISNGADGEEIISTHFKHKDGSDKL